MTKNQSRYYSLALRKGGGKNPWVSELKPSRYSQFILEEKPRQTTTLPRAKVRLLGEEYCGINQRKRSRGERRGRRYLRTEREEKRAVQINLVDASTEVESFSTCKVHYIAIIRRGVRRGAILSYDTSNRTSRSSANLTWKGGKFSRDAMRSAVPRKVQDYLHGELP